MTEYDYDQQGPPVLSPPTFEMGTEIRSSGDQGPLYEALAQCQDIMESASTDEFNPFYRSSYATLASCWKAFRAAKKGLGLALMQPILDLPDGKKRIVTRLGHTSGAWIESDLTVMPGFIEKGGAFKASDSPQALGSSLAYARRYGLCALVGIATEDDDGNEAEMASAPQAESAVRDTPKPEKKQTARALLMSLICTWSQCSPEDVPGSAKPIFEHLDLPVGKTLKDDQIQKALEFVKGQIEQKIEYADWVSAAATT